jgi:hypothetical protein
VARFNGSFHHIRNPFRSLVCPELSAVEKCLNICAPFSHRSVFGKAAPPREALTLTSTGAYPRPSQGGTLLSII